MPEVRGRSVLGRFSHAPFPGEVQTWSRALVVVDPDGVISERIGCDEPGFAEDVAAADARGDLVRTPESGWILPGFVDLHVHAPQYPQAGQALDRPLEDWLDHYTFPLEARYADAAYAARVYPTLVADILAGGTTTALMFATIHERATQILVDASIAGGLRALIGKVVADDPDQCPQNYRDASTAEALAGTESLIHYVRDHPDNADGLVLPVVTPRFVPSCTDETLRGLGELARRHDCHVQTHCSESDWADAYVPARTGMRDAEYLDEVGLLTRKTVLAHAVFLSDSDMDLVARRRSGVAHCALSNAYFANAVFPLNKALGRGVHVGLGTDISGGPVLSMLNAIQTTVTVSRMLETGVDPDRGAGERGRADSRTDWRTAFHLATAGGGVALGLPVGLFEPGYAFDAQLIDTAVPDGTIRTFGDTSSSDDVLATILYAATPPNIREVWVAGRSVGGHERRTSRHH